MTGRILVLYYYDQYPLRVSAWAHLYCFARHAPFACDYLNLANREIPPSWLKRNYDLVIFHTMFLSRRWRPKQFDELCQKIQPLKNLGGIRVALPQDEFIYSNRLCEFLNEFAVDHLYTMVNPDQYQNVFHTLDLQRVKIHTILTGYLDDDQLKRIARLSRKNTVRDIDIGYRAWHAAYWLGRHGQSKVRVAHEFQNAAPRHGLKVDISTKHADTLLGDLWYQFLLRSRYVIGVEGGASVIDREGHFKSSTEMYLKDHPNASYDEVEQACFPGQDGTLDLKTIGPRHLEACVTKTCQILVEGGYNGIFVPGVHYISVKPDYSNLDDVLSQLQDECERVEMVKRAYADIVESGRYSYESFVKSVLQTTLGESSWQGQKWPQRDLESEWQDKMSWIQVAVRWNFWEKYRRRFFGKK